MSLVLTEKFSQQLISVRLENPLFLDWGLPGHVQYYVFFEIEQNLNQWHICGIKRLTSGRGSTHCKFQSVTVQDDILKVQYCSVFCTVLCHDVLEAGHWKNKENFESATKCHSRINH